jgi:hypothetical protein
MLPVWAIICRHYRQTHSKPCNYFMQGGLCKLDWMFRCIEYQRRIEVKLSFSSFSAYVHCNRSFWYSKICGLEPKVAPTPVLLGKYASIILKELHSAGDRFQFSPLQFVKQFMKQDNEVSDEETPDENLNSSLIAMAALFDAYVELKRSAEKGKTEYYFELKEPDCPSIHGFIDCLVDYMNYAFEFKYTKNPNYYHKFNVENQLMTYFLGVPSLQRITVRAIHSPELKKNRKESLEDYYSRVKFDVQARPGYYFKDTNYFRTEFDLEAFKEKLKRIAEEISHKLDYGIDGFYQNPFACFSPSKCVYYSICDSGVISADIYRKKEVIPEQIEQHDLIKDFEEFGQKGGGKNARSFAESQAEVSRAEEKAEEPDPWAI